MPHLFAYGTLMCAEIMAEVAGASLAAEPGTLRGYCRRAVRGEAYPAIIADPAASVTGVVYRDVPARSWARLDLFEGEMYILRPVQVELADGGTLAAAAYVARPEFLARLDQDDWDFADFLRRGKDSFQGQYQGYQFLR